MRKLLEAHGWIQLVLTLMGACLAGAMVYGSLKTRVEALEKDAGKAEQFRDGFSREVAVIHTELHLMMDHFKIPHDRGSGD